MINIDELRVVVYKDNKFFIAQCLEKDIAAQADNETELYNNVMFTIQLEIINNNFNNLYPAPDYFNIIWKNTLVDDRYKKWKFAVKDNIVKSAIV